MKYSDLDEETRKLIVAASIVTRHQTPTDLERLTSSYESWMDKHRNEINQTAISIEPEVNGYGIEY